MKYIKTYEINTEENLKKLNECEKLFGNIFEEKLELHDINVIGIGGYNIYAIISKKINNNTYKDFEFLFNFFNNKEYWALMPNGENLRLDIYFENIDNMINELKILNNTNKYNL